MRRRVRALHANRLGRYERSRMRGGARGRTRGLGLRLRSARQLVRQTAVLSSLVADGSTQTEFLARLHQALVEAPELALRQYGRGEQVQIDPAQSPAP